MSKRNKEIVQHNGTLYPDSRQLSEMKKIPYETIRGWAKKHKHLTKKLGGRRLWDLKKFDKEFDDEGFATPTKGKRKGQLEVVR